MTENEGISDRIDQFGRRHPRFVWLGNAILILFVTLVLLTTTEAPLVLYQAF